VKYEVCEKSAFHSMCLAKGAVGVKKIKFGLSVVLNYLCIPSASISLDNREYTLVLTTLFESPKGPSDEKCLGPKKPLIRPCKEQTFPLQGNSRSVWNEIMQHMGPLSYAY
jgi:hypothetical protein